MELQNVTKELKVIKERVKSTDQEVFELRVWFGDRITELEAKMKAVEEAVAYLERYEEKLIVALRRMDDRRKELDERTKKLETQIACVHDWEYEEGGSYVFSGGNVDDTFEEWKTCKKCGLYMADKPEQTDDIPY